jgi:hypothetical protein
MAEITNNPHDPNEGGQDHHGAVSHERRDIDIFRISAFGIGLLLACIVTVFVMWAMFDFLQKREDAKNDNLAVSQEMLKEKNRQPPEPRLQAAPRVELHEMLSDENEILTGYGWVDPDKKIVRIPIEEAMDLVAKRGLPYKASPAGSANDGYRMIPEDSSSGRTLEKISQ